MTLEFKDEAQDLYNLKEHLWSQALKNVEEIFTLDAENNTDYAERLYQHLEEVFMYDGEIPSITEINDYLWFETDSIYEAIGLNENGEIPTVVDEAREKNESYIIAKESIEDIEKSNLFDEQFVDFLKEEAEDTALDCITFYFEDLENNSDKVTEEQIEFLNEI